MPSSGERVPGLERPPLDAAVARRGSAAPDSRRSARGATCVAPVHPDRRRGLAQQQQARRVVDLRVRQQDPGHGRGADALRAVRRASPSSCWRRSGEALARNHGPSAPRIASDDCVRGRAAVPVRAASHVGQRQFHCGKPPPAAEPRIRARTGDGRNNDDRARTIDERSMNVEPRPRAGRGRGRRPRPGRGRPGACASSTPASTGGSSARRRTRIRSRSCRWRRELRARRVALVAADGLDPEDLRTAAARVGARAAAARGTIAWALDDTLPMARGPPGAGGRRRRRPRRLRRGPVEERRHRPPASSASSSAGRGAGPDGDRGPRRARRAVDERRPRARRRAAERRHARRPRRARGGAARPARRGARSGRRRAARARGRGRLERRRRRGSSSCATSPPDAPVRPRLALVGKAVTFDAGGYFLKPQSDIVRQKGDMAGGAAVLAALGAIAELELPLDVVGVLPACENMIGADAIRPSDVITTAAGLTVEVTNPDAEGRLILADALWYARRHEGATHVIDLATLTGAMRAGMGDLFAGVFGNDDNWRDAIVDAGTAVGDLAWPWPMHRALPSACSSRGSPTCATRRGGRTGIRSRPRPSSSASPARARGRTSTCSGPRCSTTTAATRSAPGRAATACACSSRSPRASAAAAPEGRTGGERPSTRSDASRRRRRLGRRVVRYVNSSVCAASRAATTTSWCGENRQTGSVAAASPVRRSAWQRQPPQSSSCRPSGHERHGSCIQSVPRKRVNASDSCQIQSSEWSPTLGTRGRGSSPRPGTGAPRRSARRRSRSAPSRPCTASAGPRSSPGAPRAR